MFTEGEQKINDQSHMYIWTLTYHLKMDAMENHLTAALLEL